MSVPGGTVRVQAARRGGDLQGLTRTDYRNPVQMRRAYKFRAYLTRPQERRLAGVIADLQRRQARAKRRSGNQ
jgi:hypothetical protein